LQFFYHPDHIGSSNYITDVNGEVYQHLEYFPSGETFVEQRKNTEYTTYYFSGKELDTETGLYYFGARYYDPRVGIFLTVDPLIDKYPFISAYAYCLNNPVRYIDPDGRSTHKNEEGKVIAVYDNKDLGVYRHTNESLKGFDPKKMSLTTIGVEKMGETENWDEFVNPETRKAMTNITIAFGISFDPLIEKMHDKAQEMDLKEISSKSAGGEFFDIKKDYKNIGALLNGKYATSRSAGNFLAGYNAESGTYFGASISFETFQKLAGAVHIEESNGKTLSTKQKMSIVFRGTYNSSDISKFKPPTYGENSYQYRMSKAGWEYGENKRK